MPRFEFSVTPWSRLAGAVRLPRRIPLPALAGASEGAVPMVKDAAAPPSTIAASVATRPPATRAPASRPPATRAPASRPPASRPPASRAPASRAGGRQPAASTAAAGALATRTAPADTQPDDIKGAFGTLRADTHDEPASWSRRLKCLLAIMGPGLIVMFGDNDAGGVSTYAQAGQNYGTRLLWVLVLLIPVLIVNQEMVARLGAVTGVGHARLILERFGRSLAAFSVGNLMLLNGLIIVTEFIGVALAGSYFGLPRWISVICAAALLVGFTVSGSYRRWERWMYALIAVNAVVIPLILTAHVKVVPVAQGLVPGLPGGLNARVLLLVIAIVGTTVAPWQLYFQQSIVVDKRITPRWIAYERADTVIGSFAVVIGAAALIAVTAFGFAGTALHGNFGDAGGVAAGLAHTVGHHAGGMFALLLLDASLIGAAAVTLATSFALGDLVGARHSLQRSIKDAPLFYSFYAFFLAAAGAVVLIPGAPLGLITEGVQALAGVLLPASTIILIMLCNDKEILGPWVNKPWLNGVAGVIVGVLVLLSLTLTAATLFPHLTGRQLTDMLTGGAVLGLGLAAGWLLARLISACRRPARQAAGAMPGAGAMPAGGTMSARGTMSAGGAMSAGGTMSAAERLSWRMPPLALLRRPAWSMRRRVAMFCLRCYLVGAVALVILKIVQLAAAH
jgi:NRAMP (natural resistance-associated macrophage protein)-like metal ion transporter